MDQLRVIEDRLQRLNGVTDWKFALGLHIRFANPTLSYVTYPKEWVDYYTEKQLVFVDPTVRWAISNQGICDWADLSDGDESDVFGAASRFGLRYGKVIALGELDRSIGFFAHPSRPITQEEIEQAQSLMQELHDVTRDALDMSDKELEELRQIPVQP
ncbi:transcriptional regulator [Thioclava sp. NG1]|uniref:autoinducer binding domain-containing protein n=1 Tax=Thioclava sp. NG1 TaxID=2182426 RepID=UPI000D6220F7|nr:autoinducer binding domain-containing protein [Thioclava sp. NG1]PWE50924.1 transcriptional regulator [Thioclava sp. NG1]